uniref:Uncharacterized protein n=1 Tax=Arundo donax TaxID=35708 RepID=A0A0A9ENK1_ARUDO
MVGNVESAWGTGTQTNRIGSLKFLRSVICGFGGKGDIVARCHISDWKELVLTCCRERGLGACVGSPFVELVGTSCERTTG